MLNLCCVITFSPKFNPSHLPRALLFTPDIGIVVLCLSVLLIFYELNRPGRVIPGVLGLAGVLLALSSWRQWRLSDTGLLFLAMGLLLPVWQLRHESSIAWTVLSGLLLTAGLFGVIAGAPPAHVHLPVAALCGLSLGSGASLLARIAHRARRNKGLN